MVSRRVLDLATYLARHQAPVGRELVLLRVPTAAQQARALAAAQARARAPCAPRAPHNGRPDDPIIAPLTARCTRSTPAISAARRAAPSAGALQKHPPGPWPVCLFVTPESDRQQRHREARRRCHRARGAAAARPAPTRRRGRGAQDRKGKGKAAEARAAPEAEGERALELLLELLGGTLCRRSSSHLEQARATARAPAPAVAQRACQAMVPHAARAWRGSLPVPRI